MTSINGCCRSRFLVQVLALALTGTLRPGISEGREFDLVQSALGQTIGEALPDKSKYKVFKAVPPYIIDVNGEKTRIRLGTYGSNIDIERSFDMVGPLVNRSTGRINAMSWQVAFPFSDGTRHINIHDTSDPQPSTEGVPGRIEYNGKQLRLAYLAGDPPDGGDPPKCRVQINSWNVPTRRDLAWDLSFQLGGSTADESWPILPPGKSPTLLWQLKAEPGHPTLSMITDTDDPVAGTVKLYFESRTFETAASNRTVAIGGLRPGTPIQVFMTANLDERNAGSGYWHIWVNGRQIGSYDGATLRSDFTNDSHRWTIGVYLFGEKRATSFSRITYWQRASMLVPK
jgi:hypothetical protein